LNELSVFVGLVTDFDSASGLSATQLNGFFKSLTLAIGGAFSCWLMVAGIRSWMRGQADALETGFVITRAMLLVVALGAIVSWF